MTEQKATQPKTVVEIDEKMAPADESAPDKVRVNPAHLFGKMRHSPEKISAIFMDQISVPLKRKRIAPLTGGAPGAAPAAAGDAAGEAADG